MAKPPIDLLLVLRRTSRARKPSLDKPSLNDELRAHPQSSVESLEHTAFPGNLPAALPAPNLPPAKADATTTSTGSAVTESTLPTTPERIVSPATPTPADPSERTVESGTRPPADPLTEVTSNYTTFKHVLRRQRIAAIARQYQISRLAEGHPCTQNDPPVFKRGKR